LNEHEDERQIVGNNGHRPPSLIDY